MVISSHIVNRRGKLARHGIGNYLFFAVYAWFEFLRISLTRNYRTLFLTVPPPTTSGIPLLARALRKRVIVDIQDLWPEILVDVGYVRAGSFVHVVLLFLLRRLILGGVDSVTTVSEDLAEKIRATTTRPVRVVQSLADPALFRKASSDNDAERLRVRHGLGGRKVLLYVGVLGRAQRFENIVSAMPFVIGAYSDVILMVIGSGDQTDSLRSLALKLGLSQHVLFLPPVPHSDVPAYMSLADICLLPLDATEVEALPTKFFEYLASGRPVVATSSLAVSEILRDSGAGVFVRDPSNSDELGRAILGLLSDDEARMSMGSRAREYAMLMYNKLPEQVLEVIQPRRA
jgi:glycosyltransferase involved in cell wall biosynthesis